MLSTHCWMVISTYYHTCRYVCTSLQKLMSSFQCYNNSLKNIWYILTVNAYFLNTQPGWGRGNKSKLDCFVMERWWLGWKESLRAYKKSLPCYKQPKTWCCILARGDPKVLIHISVKMLRVSTSALLSNCLKYILFVSYLLY